MGEALNLNDIQLYNLLKVKIGEKEAEVLVDYVRSSVTAEFRQHVDVLATREFVKDEIHKLHVEVKETKSEIIKGMFIFWVGSIFTTIGALVAYAKFLK